ncbi:MAG: hypothetical protein KDB61_08400, partial [Planctomycetes bacterium]|nr:hypothetical protein [Planctomycetota bacterium]
MPHLLRPVPLFASATLLGALWCLAPAEGQKPSSEAKAHFVGNSACIDCHAGEYLLWRGSHHDRAMDVANDTTVLGNFADATFAGNGKTSRFYRKGAEFWVHTEGPDGEDGDFQITHTFGFEPLQQYLVAFPGGRFQCLPIAWDMRKKEWFHLRAQNPVEPDDWLHWTRPAGNWNGMCASCHSTDLNKGYDFETETYDTTWFGMDVGCESCHGPASDHLAWAQESPEARAADRTLGLQQRTSKITPRAQVELCARCHSRRLELADFEHPGGDMLDSFIPDLLNEGEYFADGQILDEVYVYGSFVQSRMYKEGVHCANCHEVHSGTLRAQGNALCLQCHKPTYDSPEHHHHSPFTGTPAAPRTPPIDGTQCVSCHMGGRTYMGLDYRLDHSMRIPRPDLSVSLGLPNTCNACHSDKDAQWARDKVVEWYGEERPQHFAPTIAAGRRMEAGADAALAGLIADGNQPAIVRATAIVLL